MVDLSLNNVSATDLLSKALEQPNDFFSAIKSVNGKSILSVWKPSKDIHIADLLVARAIASTAILGCKCTVLFSNYLSRSNLIKDEEKQRASTFCVSFYKELFRLYCNGDLVSHKRIFPSDEIKPFKKIETLYREFVEKHPKTNLYIDNDPDNGLVKDWQLDPAFALPLIKMVAHENPDILICGRKHAWIWEPFVFNFIKNANLPTPQVFYVKNIEGISTEILKENDIDCIFANYPKTKILRLISKIKKNSIRQNNCLNKLLDWLCFPSGATFKNEDQEITSFEIWHEQDIDAEVRFSAANHLIYESLTPIRNLIDERQYLFAPPQPSVITNTTIANIVEGTLNFGKDFFDRTEHKPIQLDQDPDMFRESYYQAAQKIYKIFNYQKDVEDKLQTILKECKGIDRLLTLFNKRHRDHFIHQFNVYGLGLLLLDSKVNGELNLRTWIADQLNISVRNVDTAWAIAALFHDHAYPLGYILSLQDRMHMLSTTDHEKKQIKELNESLINVIPSTYERSLWPIGEDWKSKVRASIRSTLDAIGFDIGIENIETDFSPDSLLVDHGLLSATNLWAHMHRPNRDEIEKVLKYAFLAIAEHNIDKMIEFDNAPLSTLLRLCDELHEWGRPVLTNNGYLCPLEKISLNLINKSGTGMELPEQLEVMFHCSSKNILKKTNWDEGIFWKNKQKAIKMISLSKQIRPQKMLMSLTIPSHVYGQET